MFQRNVKKRDLQAHKEKLLQEIKYYEERISVFSHKSSNVYFGADSSDSEDGFPTFLDIGPTISELKQQDRQLKTCLQATQELTSVTVLESEVQLLAKEPDIQNEKPVSEPGLWKEVTAECRIDLVPFTILFYVHQPSRRFSSASYRGLRVQAVKAAHEAELAASVLHTLTSPADVLETVRSYAGAYRSRRSTLARLADAHAGTLYMQPREEGGFVLKCGSVMQMSWRLENKSSPLAPFQHKMNFELDYMDESYLKIIKQAHRRLSDPSLQTDERTQLLSKIISTCIEAQGQDIESDTDSKKLNKTTLDDDDSDVNPEEKEEERDREVMAPPKAIPKKSKPKGKENIDENRKSVKRGAHEVDGAVKRAKTDDKSVNSGKNREVNHQTVEKPQKVKVAGRPDENTDKETVKDNGKISQVDDKRLSKKSKNENDKQSDVSDAKKKKTNDVNEKAAKNIKTNDVNEKAAKNIKTTDSKETDKAKNNILEQRKQSEQVISHSSKNIKASIEGGSKISKEHQPASNTNKVSNKLKAQNVVNDPNTKIVANHNNNAKKSVNSDTVKTKKPVSSDTNVNNEAKTTNLESIKSKKSVTTEANADKATNSDSANTKSKSAETNNKKNDKTKTVTAVKPISTNVKKAIAGSNADKVATGKAKITKHTDVVKKTINDEANSKKTANPETEITKKSINIKKTNANTASKNAKINIDSDKIEEINPNLTRVNKNDNINPNPKKVKKVSNVTDNVTKALSVDPNIKQNDITKKNNTIKSRDNSHPEKITLDTDKTKMNSNPANVKNTTNKILTNKNDTNSKKSLENAKNPKEIKNKMVIKNHRNSSGKVKKGVVKPVLLKESKIPQKKLSPAYAAVLKQNPLRVSPRMQSKFKSSSDTNIQSKIFKPVTNIPRLLKKPAPKSK